MYQDGHNHGEEHQLPGNFAKLAHCGAHAGGRNDGKGKEGQGRNVIKKGICVVCA